VSCFSDRAAAGRELAGRLDRYAGRDDTVVLGLARGGVPVAYEVAGALGLPLDVFLVRKLGAPGHDELAMGAIASGGVRVITTRSSTHCGRRRTPSRPSPPANARSSSAANAHTAAGARQPTSLAASP
jgi:predicted phosphoribosyltransferase